ncbi:MAG TPA: chalcone isomerase family protein [Burkholderiaceae bacterium]
MALATATFSPTIRAQAPEITAALPEARLSGQSLYRYFGFAVYQIRLFVAPGFNRADYTQSPLALELEYQRDFAGADIAARSLKEMQRAGGFTEAQGAQWLQQMKAVFPNIKEGDKLLGLYTPGAGARFLYNGKPAGEVKDAEFARRFFGIWLAPSTSEPALRQTLLGGAAQ